MIVHALLVAIVYFLASWGTYGIGVFHLNRPIVVGPLVGLALGDLQTGIILGATFESVFLGVIAVGGSVPADATIGATIGTAIAILTGAKSDTALAIAVPVALFGVALSQVAISVVIPLFMPKMDALAEAGDSKGLTRMHWFMSLFVGGVLQAIVIFFAVWLGSNAISSVLKSIPQFITHGFQAAGAMLPAVGFALLLNMLFNKKLFAFFFLGFVLSIYLKLPSLAIAIIAVVFAITQYYNSEKNANVAIAGETKESSTNINGEEDFFNE
ncbi:PTS mannose/fructose/sorbose/N-acetylgalactosamine transporter subunit IIC [Thermoanaerobacterium thermosaccharolyticum]|uniref:PTS mannose/fructose/sorbose/N-acetylgalactosamine transporter subunit IIC n=1 Tax=Thermoanaerobacterium thermosaccharolyticum TaxID=1517 RepID=UPI001238E749|nr:PTS sugar transporter subunit IIC [Thermoanaerobacterium thermosaccharolyticum]KAA5806020.1 PTS sugar transporter subunit IIC [Thermoanaerobacterium thermosaccharolyticum]